MAQSLPRQHYTVVILDSRPERAAPLMTNLTEGGFRPRHFASDADLIASLKSHPPHVVLFHRGDDGIDLENALTTLRARLPETHFLVLAPAASLVAAWREWGGWIDDCLLTPPIHSREVVRAVERALAHDALLYRNEELQEQASQASKLASAFESFDETNLVSARAAEVGAIEQAVEKVLAQARTSPSVEGELQSIELQPLNTEWASLLMAPQLSDLLSESVRCMADLVRPLNPDQAAAAVFLRYLPSRRCLVATAARGLAPEIWPTLGLDLSEEEFGQVRDLRHPERLTGLKEMAEAVTGSDQVWVQPLILRDQVYGLMLAFGEVELERAQFLWQITRERAEWMDLKDHLHKVETRDGATGLFHRRHFESLLEGEIARARRILSPVSLIVLRVDGYQNMVAHGGVEEAEVALMALGKIIAPRSRANDQLGRLAADSVGLLLPHTPAVGATLKAERIRRLVAAADFSQILPSFGRITVSAGVAEYPSCCRDGEELLGAAEDALWQIRSQTNKVCVVPSSDGFEPDFQVAAR